MARGTKPRDHFHEFRFSHRGATSSRAIYSAANMEKNRAPGAGNGRVGVVADFDQPVIGKVARPHFFVRVVVRRIFRIDDDVAIVIRRP